MSGFRALMNVERVGWTASSWAMPSQGPTDPRVAPTRQGLAGKDTLGVQCRPRHMAGVGFARFSRGGPGFVATSKGPNGPAPAPLRGDSVRPPWHMATGGRSRRNTTPICTLLNPRVQEVRIVILCASRRTSPCRQEAGHRGPHVGSFAQRAPLYERLELPGALQVEHPMLSSQGHEGCADMFGQEDSRCERKGPTPSAGDRVRHCVGR